MKKKLGKILFVFIILFSICFSTGKNSTRIYAQTPTINIPTPIPSISSAGNQQDKITNLKNRAQAEIDRRTTSLNNLLTKINNIKKLSLDQKSSFSSQIQAEISNLNSLKTKISSDIDLATLRTDVQSIITSYRVFALFLPQINIMAAADRIITLIEQISPIISKLQNRIQQAQAKGNNVTSLQPLLTDMQNKLNDANLQSNSALTSVSVLQPTGYPGNKTTLQNDRNLLKTAYQDLLTFKQDAKNIIQTLASLNKTNSTTLSSFPSPTIISPSH